MFHCRSLNNRINNIHEGALRLVYNDSYSSFNDLLDKDKSVSIHMRNIQAVAIELFKVYKGVASDIFVKFSNLNRNAYMNLGFHLNLVISVHLTLV